MAMTSEQKTINRMAKKIIDGMRNLGTYREQFLPTIHEYVGMRFQLDYLNKEFYKTGMKITEQYTNNSGATNERKTALYSAIEKLRLDIVTYEDKLGLTPSGMKRINDAEMKGRKKASKLNDTLDKMKR